MNKTVWKWVILTLLAGYVGFMAVWARGEANRHVCTGIDIEVDGSHGVADSLAKASLELELTRYPRKLTGARPNTINTLDVERFLSKFNYFESVECILTPAGVLKVRAVPMIPEIRVFEPDGRSYYVNKDGKRIDANAKFFVDVPIVQGDFSRSAKAANGKKGCMKPSDFLTVVRAIKADPRLSEIVSGIKINDPQNILLIPRVGGHVINIGDTSRLAEKRRALMTAYLGILPMRGWETYDTISVKFRNQVVCSRRHKLQRPDFAYEEETDLEEATLEGLEEGSARAGNPRSGDI